MVRVINHRKYGLVVVYETPGMTAASDRTLMFDSPSTQVRIGNFPADWQALSADALLALVVGEGD